MRSNIQKFLDDKDCANFLAALLAELPSKVVHTERYDGSLLGVFNRVNSNGGFWVGNVNGLALTDPNFLKTTFRPGIAAMITSQSREDWFLATVTEIHELNHDFTKSPSGGHYGHFDMANAARKAADKLGMNLKGMRYLNLQFDEFPTQIRSGAAYDTSLAWYFHAAVANACKNVK